MYGRHVTDRLGVALEGAETVRAHRRLQGVDLPGLEGVDLAAVAIAVKAADGQGNDVLGPRQGMHFQHLVLNAREPDAGNARRHAGEELRHQGARQADGLEVVAAAIGADDRNAHLRHDLEKPVIDGLLEAAQAGLQVDGAEEPAAVAVGEGFLGQIGVHRRRPDADEDGEVMDVHALARVHVERGKGAQVLAHQMGVHGAGGQDHGHGGAPGADVPVAQDDMDATAPDRGFRLLLDTDKGLAEHVAVGFSAAHGVEGAVDLHRRVAQVGPHPLEFGVQQHRRFQLHQPALGFVLVQDVAQVAEPRSQRHHLAFAQGVDGRVGHLAEVLTEEVMEAAVFVRQHGHRRVVAHGARGLLGLLGHGVEDEFQVLHAPPGGQLAPAQFLGVEPLQGLGGRRNPAVNPVDVLDPGAEGLLCGQHVLEFVVVVQPAFLQVDGNHLAGPDAPLFDDLGFVDSHHAGLGADDQQSVAGHRIAQRPEPVAVHGRQHPPAAEGGDGGGPVPGFDDRIGVGVQVPVGLGHGRLVARRIGDQHGVDHGQRAAGPHHDLVHRIEGGRVRTFGLDHRLEVVDGVAERLMRHARLMAGHPVDIAAERVDLAVVGEDAEGLGEVPGGKGVGGIALVIDGEVGNEAVVQKVRIERRQLLGQEHALVDHRTRRQRADVEFLDVLGQHRVLDAPADDVEVGLELGVAHLLGVGDHDLLDLGAVGVGLLADDADVHRHLAPPVDGVAEAQDLGLDDAAAALLGAEVGLGQEDHAHGEAPGKDLVAGALDVLLEEVLGNLQVDAGAVAGLAVGIHGAPVPHRFQRVDAGQNHLAPRLAVDGGDETDATGIVFVGRVVEAGCGQVPSVGPPLPDEPLAVLARLGAHAAFPCASMAADCFSLR